MQKNTYLLLLPILALLFSNCRPSLELQAVEDFPAVSVKTIQKASENSTYILNGKKYRFPTSVQEIQYTPQWQQLAVNLGTTRRKSAYAVYDVAVESLNWVNEGNYHLSLLQKDVALVSSPEKRILINTQTGLPIRWVDREEDFAVIDDSITLNLTKRFSRIDLKTGTTKWSRPGTTRYEGWMSDELDGNWMYVMADGLHGFNLDTGSGWHQQANTDYDATRGGRAVANGILIGLNILSVAVGGGGGAYVDNFLYSDPKRAHNIHAKPKIEENELYFADRKSIFNLEKTTGKLFWETTVKEELGVSDLKILSPNKLLLFGKGYRYVDYALDRDKQANLYLIDKNDGRILAKKTLPVNEVIVNHAINDAFIYTLTNKHIYRYDKYLEQPKRISLPTTYGAPLRVITWSSARYDEDLETDLPDFPLVIRTVQGVVALHPVTLEELWYKRLGSPLQNMPQILNSDRWQLPILMQDMELRRSWIDETTETFWFASAGKLIGLDLINEGAVVAEFELPSDDFWYVGDGELVQFGGRDVQLLKLEAN